MSDQSLNMVHILRAMSPVVKERPVPNMFRKLAIKNLCHYFGRTLEDWSRFQARFTVAKCCRQDPVYGGFTAFQLDQSHPLQLFTSAEESGRGEKRHHRHVRHTYLDLSSRKSYSSSMAMSRTWKSFMGISMAFMRHISPKSLLAFG